MYVMHVDLFTISIRIKVTLYSRSRLLYQDQTAENIQHFLNPFDTSQPTMRFATSMFTIVKMMFRMIFVYGLVVVGGTGAIMLL